MPEICGNRAETGGADLLSRFVSVGKTISCREVRAVLGENSIQMYKIPDFLQAGIKTGSPAA